MKQQLQAPFYFLVLLIWMGNAKAQTSCSAGQSLVNLYTGYGKNYTVNNATYVGNPENSLGIADAVFATVKHNADVTKLGQLTIDLTDNVPNLDTIYFVASGQDNKTLTFDVSFSSNGSSFSAVNSYTFTTSTLATYAVVVNNASGARYVRFTSTSTTKDLRVDAVSYNKKTCKDYCISSAITYTSGYATNYQPASTAANPDRALSTPNQSSFAKLDATTKVLYLDLGTVVPYGTYVQLFLAADAASTVADFSVTGSANDITYSNAQAFTTTTVQPEFTDFYYNVTQTAGIRYLKIVTTTAVKGDIDAVSYSYPNYWGSNYISGYVFADANTNTIKDGAESGASGISVKLSKDLNHNGAFDAGDNVIQSTYTTAGGAYQFQVSTLDTNYLISVLTSTLPVGNNLTTGNVQSTSFSNFNNTSCAKNFGYYTCTGNCPPVATDDYAVSTIGTGTYIYVLANDYDPNNNLNTASLQITRQPKKGAVTISSGSLIYTPAGTGYDTLTYRIADLTSPTPLWDTAIAVIAIYSATSDPCSEARTSHIFYIPAPEQDLYTCFLRADCKTAEPITDSFRTIISIKCPYAGTILYYDQWEDGYETNIQNPSQSTTLVWGDGNPYNGVAPGYSNDILPPGASIVTNNVFFTHPRNSSQFYYDAKDKILSTTDIAVSRITWEANSRKEKQAYSTDVYDVNKFGTSFNVPVGNYTGANADFQYTALFIRASQNNTSVSVDKNNDGIVDTTVTLQEGGSYFQDGGVQAGALVTSTKPVGLDVFFGDSLYCFNAKELNVLPAAFYSNTYYTPVPTTSAADTAAIMFYNPIGSAITINWTTSATSGSFNIGAKGVYRLPLGPNGYKFQSAGGENFVANELIDSWPFNVTPPYSGNSAKNGGDFDWSFGLIPENRLTPFSSIAWAPGSSDGSANGSPVWVMPTAATTIYIKWDGDILNTGTKTSPCGFKYDTSYALASLQYKKLLDADKDQSGLSVYTCNGVKIATAYGEDPSLCTIGFPYLDAGTAMQPFCFDKMLMINDDYAVTMTNSPVTVNVLGNDTTFLANIDRSTLSVYGYPTHGTASVNADGTILYTPSAGYIGYDTISYRVCSTPGTPSNVVCDEAIVVINVASCPAPSGKNIISGTVFTDVSKDGTKNNGESGFTPAKVYLYVDGNCNSTIDANELTDSVNVDASGTYQFVEYPEKIVRDDFDATATTSSCAGGSDGNTGWATNWVDSLDASSRGFCFTPAATVANTDVELIKDAGFSFALRLKDKNKSARRSINLSGATGAYLSFSYRRKSTTFIATDTIRVMASTNGTTWTQLYNIYGNGAVDAGYTTVYNLNLLPYASATTYIRFSTTNSMTDADSVYIDNINVTYLKYTQCYMTKIASSSVPANSYLTTASQYAFSIAAPTTCNNNNDFGIAKNSVTISGTLYNDANGASDGSVNGTAMGNPDGATIYAYLIDANGKVAFKVTVNADGTYSFPLADINTTYSIVLTTTNVAVGANTPSTVLPRGWGNTGETYGSNNGAGSGVEGGSANSAITVTTGTSNVAGLNFAFQRPNAGADRQSCHFNGTNTVTLTATTTPGKWTPRYDNPGTATIANDAAASTTVSNFSDGGDYYFIWTNNEASDTAKVVITKPDAGVDSSKCGGALGLLNGNYTSGTWSALPGNPAGASLSGTTNGNATVNFTNSATGNYFYSYNVNGCPDTVKLGVTPRPTAGSANGTLFNCINAGGYLGQLAATNPSPNTGVWYVESGPGTIASPTNYNAQISSLSSTGATTSAKWVVTNSYGCTDTTAVTFTPHTLDTSLITKYGNEFCLTCPVVNGSTMSYYDLNGKLLASVTDSNDAVSIGQTTFCGQLPYNVSGNPAVNDVRTVPTYIQGVGNVPQPILPRAFNIHTTNNAPMTVNLYFTDEELAALTGATLDNGGYFRFSDVSQLRLVSYPNQSDTFVPAATPNGTVYHPTFQRVGNYWQASVNLNRSGTMYIYPTYFMDDALPVELIDLKAIPKETYIKVDWATASELNSLKFDVERSEDNKTFSKIGEVAGAGNYQGIRKYTFDDKNVTPDVIYYYRLKQVDIGGKSTNTRVVAASITDNNKLKISEFMPNPAINTSVLKINSPIQMDMDVKIYSIEGTLVKEEFYPINKGESEINIDVNTFAKGLYLVQLNYNDNIEVRKLMKLQ